MNVLIGGLPVSDDAEAKLAQILRDFGPPTGIEGEFAVVTVNSEIPLAALARLALEYGRFTMRGPSDKTAGTADGTFRSIDIALADTLYGPRIWVSTGFDGDAVQLATDAARAIAKACRVIERHVFAPYAAEQARLGNVTLPNFNARLYGAYQAFRWQGQALVDGHGDNETRQLALAMSMAAADTNSIGPFFIPSVVGHYATAMTTAWFSWLEHVLVLLLPFSDWNPEDIAIDRVINLSWADKWRTVVGTSTPTAKSTFDMLTETAEAYRNRDAHGGFGKGDAGILVHTPAGAIPARMSAGLDHILSGSLPSTVATLADAAAALDKAEEFLRIGSFSYGMQWIDGGLDVAYDATRRAELRAAVAGGAKAFEPYMERVAWSQDMANNYEF